MSTKRTWYAADKVGFHMLHALFQHSMRFKNIVRYDEYFVSKLLVDGGACRGVAALDIRTGEYNAILGRAERQVDNRHRHSGRASTTRSSVAASS